MTYEWIPSWGYIRYYWLSSTYPAQIRVDPPCSCIGWIRVAPLPLLHRWQVGHWSCTLNSTHSTAHSTLSYLCYVCLISQGSTGIHKGSTGIHKGSTGIHMDPQGSTWIHKGPQGSTRVHRDPQGSTRCPQGFHKWQGVHRDPQRSAKIQLNNKSKWIKIILILVDLCGSLCLGA